MNSRSLPTLLLLLGPLFSLLPSPCQATHAKNEELCQRQFVQWMLAKQASFSDGDASPEARRNAERRIDQARQAYAQAGSFCDAMAEVNQPGTQVSALAARLGEVHSFERSPAP